jgi:hypothetical protein
MEDMPKREDVDVAGAGEGAAPVMGERERWLDTMADMQAQADRRFEGMSARIQRLERKSGSLAIPEEMKGLFLMLSIYVGVQLLLPLVLDVITEWRKEGGA